MNPTDHLPHVHGIPGVTASIKGAPDDFVVDEVLSFEPSGTGEHALVRIEKWGENTDFITRELQRFTGVKARDIGFAGLKDRHGRTLQWFSIPLPGKPDPDWAAFGGDSYRVVESTRNDKKLRRGALSGNRFELNLRELQGDLETLGPRLHQIGTHGVPNYFGPQRFGRYGDNVDQALALFKDPRARISNHLKGIYLSAARSEIFNRILALRVNQGNWNIAVPGDLYMFQGSKSYFAADANDPLTTSRIASKDIHPSGPLVGQEASQATEIAARYEMDVLDQLPELHQGLIQMGLESSRRPLRLHPIGLCWAFEGAENLKLSFELPQGAYATTVLRELITLTTHDHKEF